MASAARQGTPETGRGKISAVWTALRPLEWIKNGFVLAPLLFSGRFDETGAVVDTTIAFVCFCAAASAGYLLNDIRDAALDRAHPVKRTRPIAAGALDVGTAAVVAAVLGIAALAGAFAVAPELAAAVAAYLALTAAYTVVLKRMVILDSMAIAGCFLLRVLGGTVSADVTASEWLIVCTAMLALFLSFTKRRQEAVSEMHSGRDSRPVLEHYSLPFLDQMVSLVTAGTVISYAIYATESPIVGDEMLFTAPMVLYGIFRYLYLVYDREDPRGAPTLLRSDPGMIGAVTAWVATVLVLLYL